MIWIINLLFNVTQMNCSFIDLIDKDKMTKSGRILLTTDLASEYNFIDVNGKIQLSVKNKIFCSFV